jgi:alpha-galactosidase
MAGDRMLLRHAVSAVQLDGQWHPSVPMTGDSDGSSLTWTAGGVEATTRLIAYEQGIVIECEVRNPGPATVLLNGWRPLMVEEAHQGALHIGDEPWRASTLVNGYQSWDYAGIHPLDDAIKERDPPHLRHSWWTCAIYAPERRAMFVAQVLRAARFATAFHWRYHRDQQPASELPTAITTFYAEEDGSPLSEPEQRSGTPQAIRLALPPGGRVASDPILLLYGEDGTATLRRALAVAGRASGAQTATVPPRGWCSWYHLGLAVSDADIRRHAAFVSTRLPQLAASLPRPHRPVIQLDDGWMPPRQRWGDWVPNESFAEGFPAMVQAVRRRRLRAGIWVAPFLVAGDSQLAAEHADWLVRRDDGTPLVDPRMGRPYHVLDVTHPAAADHLATVFSGLRADGFTYFKIDFLYAGAYEGRRHDGTVTGTEALRLGLRRIVDAVNPPSSSEKAFIVACGAPLLPIVGLVHGARIGGDVGAPQMQDGKAAPPHVGFPLVLSMARNTAARVFFDRTLFTNDPDVVMVASPQLSLDEARVMVTVAALSGGIFMLSDDLDTLPAERLALVRNPNLLALVGGPAAEPRNLFAAPEREARDHWFAFPQELPPVWVRPEPGGRAVVAVFNWSDEPRPYVLRFVEVTGEPGSYRLLDLWSARRGGRSLGTRTRSVRLALPPHSVRLLRMEPAAAARTDSAISR